MFKYHGTELNRNRLEKGVCRCASEGVVYDISALSKDGFVCDPHSRNPLNTTPLHTPSETAGKFIFGIDVNYTMHVAPDGVRKTQNSVKHETLFHNADLRAAGEIQFENGIVTNINDHSASYDTFSKLEQIPDFADAFLIAVDRLQVFISKALRNQLEQYRMRCDQSH